MLIRKGLTKLELVLIHEDLSCLVKLDHYVDKFKPCTVFTAKITFLFHNLYLHESNYGRIGSQLAGT